MHLQDIQQRRIASKVECKVKFDVADVACPVVSLGNRRVEIFRKGRIFALQMRRSGLKDKVQMVAPIEEVVAGEMKLMTMEKNMQEWTRRCSTTTMTT